MGQRERERDKSGRERIQVWERERDKDGRETERQEYVRERIQKRRERQEGERQE